MDCSPPGSSVHGISQARTLEWVAIPPPGDLPHPGTEPVSLVSPALAGEFFTTGATWEAAPHSFLLKKMSHVISNQLDQGFSAAALLTFGII